MILNQFTILPLIFDLESFPILYLHNLFLIKNSSFCVSPGFVTSFDFLIVSNRLNTYLFQPSFFINKMSPTFIGLF